MHLKKFIATLISSVMVCTFISSYEISVSSEEEQKYIALTFDDGPNTDTTNEVLDILEQYNAKASFFLIGDFINDSSAETVKRAYDMGCEINNHSKSHPTMSSMTEEEIKAEVEYVNEKVYEIIGEYPKFFRPPFIATSQTMYDVIDMPFICGVGCNDFMENVTAEERADVLINSAKDGIIYLLHDSSGNDKTVEALKTAMPVLVEQGYEFVTLTELFEKQGEVPNEDLIYSEVAKYPCNNYTLKRNIFSGEITGDSGSGDWGSTTVLDIAELESLGDTYAIEVEYNCTQPPVVVMQCWSKQPTIWQTAQPFYSNGEKACFLASDILKVAEDNDIVLSELDKMCIYPYGDTLTITNIDLLIKNEDSSESSLTDELKELKKYILGNSDNKYSGSDCFDVVSMKNSLINK